MDDILEQHGVTVIHHFSEREYAKETHIPAGVELTQHRHKFSHLSLLASGIVSVSLNDEEATTYEAPACITIPAGLAHRVFAHTDTVWFCIHATNGEMCVDSLESEVIA